MTRGLTIGGIEVVNLALRLATSAGRFVLLLVMARYLPAADVGVFGLVMALIVFATYAVGVDYYVHNTRELLRTREVSWPNLMRDQGTVHLAAYVIAIPILLFLLLSGVVPAKAALWVVPLLITDHLSLELHRVLIARSFSRRANVVLFLRSGIWGYGASLALWLAPGARQLNTIWATWLCGSVVSLVVASYWARDVIKPRDPSARWSKARVLQGLRVAFPFLLSSLAIRGISTVDRYSIELHHSTELVGVYTLFYGASNLLLLAVEAGIVQVQFPALVAARLSNLTDTYDILSRRFTRSVLLGVIGGSAAATLAIRPVMRIVDNPVYSSELTVFWLLLAAAGINTLSLVPHYALYAEHQDRSIVRSGIVGFLVALILNLALVPRFAAAGAAVATLGGMFAIFLAKTAATKIGRRIGQ